LYFYVAHLHSTTMALSKVALGDDWGALASMGQPQTVMDCSLSRRLSKKTPDPDGTSYEKLTSSFARKRLAATSSSSTAYPVMRPDLSKHQFIQDFTHKLVKGLSDDSKNGLAMTIASWPGSVPSKSSETLAIKVGTVCSGSEIFLSSLRHLSNALHETLGMKVVFVHCWSFEWKGSKRMWIQANWKPICLFGDVTQVSDSGEAFNYMTMQTVKIESVDIIIAGVSCVDASRLSVHQDSRRSAVAEGSHSTGSTFKGCMRLAELLQPKKVILENVPSLMDQPKDGSPSNFQAVVAAVHAINYSFAYAVFDARDTGLQMPQHPYPRTPSSIGHIENPLDAKLWPTYVFCFVVPNRPCRRQTLVSSRQNPLFTAY
jgi:hypothetical protein